MNPSQPVILDGPASGPRDILSMLVDATLAVRSDCAGRGMCGKCRILIHGAADLSPVTGAERQALSALDLEAGYRLACQARASGTVTVSLPEESRETREAIGKTNAQGTFPTKPVVSRVVVRPGFSSQEDSRDVVSLLGNMLEREDLEERTDPRVLSDLSSSWNRGSAFTLVTHRSRGITGVIPGQKDRSLGFAVDIGTTTVAGYLCDLMNGKILSAAGCANPQRRHGEDVISRIHYASREREGLHTHKELVTSEINRLMADCLNRVECENSDIDEMLIVGNSAMQHLFCGVHPGTLGRSPYRPVMASATDWSASDLDIDLHAHANVHVFPVISGFVGGDTVAAVISQDLDMPGAVSLLVDIGTNGEAVISRDRELWVTSCATGPALEGAHISSGIRAVSGAIEKVRVDPHDLHVTCEVLGQHNGARPRGICGSGIIDALAEMRKAGLVLANGRLNEAANGIAVDAQGIGRSFTLVSAEATSIGRPIQVTLHDIRQNQLAKAALAVGIKLLMKAAGVDEVDRLILTGAFGARFDWKNAASIGMLPPNCVSGKVETVANAAGLGAVLALLNRDYRERATSVSNQANVLELAEHPEFETEFFEAMNFPD
ncbi:MAG: ASKHA domain-containing protein [Chloroflexota bacterium]